MSAEKCGNPVGVVVVSPETVQNEEPPTFLSGHAFRTLKRIRHKFPDFDPTRESDIWFKARAMGLTEEE